MRWTIDRSCICTPCRRERFRACAEACTLSEASGCVRQVEAALIATPGVREAAVSLVTHKAEVRCHLFLHHREHLLSLSCRHLSSSTMMIGVMSMKSYPSACSPRPALVLCARLCSVYAPSVRKVKKHHFRIVLSDVLLELLGPAMISPPMHCAGHVRSGCRGSEDAPRSRGGSGVRCNP